MVETVNKASNADTGVRMPLFLRALLCMILIGSLAACIKPSINPGPESDPSGSEAPITDREPVDLNPVSPARVGDLLFVEYEAADTGTTWGLETEGLVFSDGGSIRIVPNTPGEPVRVEVSYSDAVGDDVPNVGFEGGRIRISTPETLIENASFTCTVYANIDSVDIGGTVSLDWNCSGRGTISISHSAVDGVALEFPISVSVYNIAANSVSVATDGPSTWMLMGNAVDASISADGGAVVFGANLNAENASLSVLNGSKVEISVSKTLSATTDSGGSIGYYGSPEVTSSGQSISQLSGSMGKA